MQLYLLFNLQKTVKEKSFSCKSFGVTLLENFLREGGWHVKSFFFFRSRSSKFFRMLELHIIISGERLDISEYEMILSGCLSAEKLRMGLVCQKAYPWLGPWTAFHGFQLRHCPSSASKRFFVFITDTENSSETTSVIFCVFLRFYWQWYKTLVPGSTIQAPFLIWLGLIISPHTHTPELCSWKEEI